MDWKERLRLAGDLMEIVRDAESRSPKSLTSQQKKRATIIFKRLEAGR